MISWRSPLSSVRPLPPAPWTQLLTRVTLDPRTRAARWRQMRVAGGRTISDSGSSLFDDAAAARHLGRLGAEALSLHGPAGLRAVATIIGRQRLGHSCDPGHLLFQPVC